MLTASIKALAGWKGYAALGGVMLAVGFAGGWTVRDWKAGAEGEAAAKEQVKVVERIVWRERAQADVTSRIETRAAEAQVQIRTVTRTLIQEVPVYVTPDADDRCIVPVGFVRLHDAAAAGGAVPEPAGLADDAPSGLELSAVAAGVAENYGDVCRANAQQLSDLQAWVREQQRVSNQPATGE